MCPNQYAHRIPTNCVLFRDSTPSSLIFATQRANSIHPEWFPFEKTFSLNQCTTKFPKFFFLFLYSLMLWNLAEICQLRLRHKYLDIFKIFTKFLGIYIYLVFFCFLNSTIRQSSEGFNPYFARTIQFSGFRSESYMLAVSNIVQTVHVLMMLMYKI